MVIRTLVGWKRRGLKYFTSSLRVKTFKLYGVTRTLKSKISSQLKLYLLEKVLFLSESY